MSSIYATNPALKPLANLLTASKTTHWLSRDLKLYSSGILSRVFYSYVAKHTECGRNRYEIDLDEARKKILELAAAHIDFDTIEGIDFYNAVRRAFYNFSTDPIRPHYPLPMAEGVFPQKFKAYLKTLTFSNTKNGVNRTGISEESLLWLKRNFYPETDIKRFVARGGTILVFKPLGQPQSMHITFHANDHIHPICQRGWVRSQIIKELLELKDVQMVSNSHGTLSGYDNPQDPQGDNLYSQYFAAAFLKCRPLREGCCIPERSRADHFNRYWKKPIGLTGYNCYVAFDSSGLDAFTKLLANQEDLTNVKLIIIPDDDFITKYRISDKSWEAFRDALNNRITARQLAGILYSNEKCLKSSVLFELNGSFRKQVAQMLEKATKLENPKLGLACFMQKFVYRWAIEQYAPYFNYSHSLQAR